MLVDIDVFQHDSGLGLIYSKYVGSYHLPRKWLRISTKYKHFKKVHDQKNIDLFYLQLRVNEGVI